MMRETLSYSGETLLPVLILLADSLMEASEPRLTFLLPLPVCFTDTSQRV